MHAVGREGLARPPRGDRVREALPAPLGGERPADRALQTAQQALVARDRAIDHALRLPQLREGEPAPRGLREHDPVLRAVIATFQVPIAFTVRPKNPRVRL